MTTQDSTQTAQPESVVSTTLLDLNVDCLLKIFRTLNLADVTRLAEVCQLFRDLAAETFKYEWKNKTIRLSNKSLDSKLETTAILRHFGNQLRNVQVIFDKCGNETLFNLVIDKCSSQLTQVDFSSTCFNVHLKTVLSKVNIRRFNAKFGNLKRMRFENNTEDITEPECIEQHFPALEELSLFGYPFKNQHVRQFVKFNPQVKSLFMFHYNNVQEATDIVEIIDQQLPQLEELGLWIHGQANEIVYQPRFLTRLRRLKIHKYGNAAYLQHLSISNESVSELELELSFCDDNLINFVCQYKLLTKLAIRMYSDSPFDCQFLTKLKKHLPNLAEVEICGFCKNLIHTDIALFVHGSKQLVNFILRDAQRKNILEDVNTLQKKLDSSQWTVDYNVRPRQLQIVRVKTAGNK